VDQELNNVNYLMDVARTGSVLLIMLPSEYLHVIQIPTKFG